MSLQRDVAAKPRFKGKYVEVNGALVPTAATAAAMDARRAEWQKQHPQPGPVATVPVMDAYTGKPVRPDVQAAFDQDLRKRRKRTLRKFAAPVGRVYVSSTPQRRPRERRAQRAATGNSRDGPSSEPDLARPELTAELRRWLKAEVDRRMRLRVAERHGLDLLAAAKCLACGNSIVANDPVDRLRPKRQDAKFCSDACRQRAYRKRVAEVRDEWIAA